jgi:valyl-tRNA synthetase
MQAGYFSRDAGGFADNTLPPFTIVIPPPNVTGMLHMGHALNNTLQDILIRQARMQGRPTRWIVGTDHAGIATQNKVEQRLIERGLTRFDLGREAFVEACWKWRQEFGSTIIEQLKAMGCSCDFNNERFTLDEGYVQAVRKVFVDWYHQGLVYRGNRIINWCPRCTTALADDEVVHVEEMGHLWQLRYPLVEPQDGRAYLVVATTRPETMLGDSAVAVHPDDPRYQPLLAAGARLRLPLTERTIPLIADQYVDPHFGTGALKVTPAHDPNDFELGRRHELEFINIFDERAVVNHNGGRFQGLSRAEAREAVLAALKEADLLETTHDHVHAVGHCYRCDTTIEPWLSEQWFVAMRELAAPAIAAVREGRVRFFPDRWHTVYFDWLENIRDWCISRQLWWGHRIPVFYCESCGWQDALIQDISDCPRCGEPLRQDEDVLDTWFSSQLWPFATYGWPATRGFEHQLECYYPTQALSTARDIIFLWVARMVISSLYFIDGQVPFTDVLIHPTVLDKKGNIMSKSRGNGIDPLELIERYGADGMRFGLALQVTGSQDLRFNADTLLGARNFATKIWNAARFVLQSASDKSDACSGPAQATPVCPQPVTPADRWILSRLARLAVFLTDEADDYDFGTRARALYGFFWNEYCDWYLEYSKGQLADTTLRYSTIANLVYVLDKALRLLHPYMPFITEYIWHLLPHGDARPHLMVAQWPDATALTRFIDPSAEALIGHLNGIVAALRSIRARYGIGARQELDVVVNVCGSHAKNQARLLIQQEQLLRHLGRIARLCIEAGATRPAHAAVIVGEEMEIFVPLEGLVNLDAEAARLAKEHKRAATELTKREGKLANPGFLSKADPIQIEKTQTEATELRETLRRLQAQIEALH